MDGEFSTYSVCCDEISVDRVVTAVAGLQVHMLYLVPVSFTNIPLGYFTGPVLVQSS